ncbi:angiopoietin-4-like [Liolophura sinensis]|uniref:angiopoietin-4-like n=1 Tax=Liolophura sinensis TaxID=3198878 RepID=UPI0031590590
MWCEIDHCSDPQIKKDPSSTNRYGTAYIFPDTASEPFLVYCDLHYGFTFLQARVSQSCTRTSFQRSWQDYRDGFGDFTCDFWLGLDKIHQITSQAQYKLEILIDDGTGYKQCFYDPFRVEGASSNFTASLVQFDEDPDCNSFLGNDAGFGINNIPFSTTDHDSTTNRCPSVLTSGWWFDNVCPVGNPNGPYISQNTFLNNNSPPRLRIGGTYAGKWVKEFLMRIENVGG